MSNTTGGVHNPRLHVIELHSVSFHSTIEVFQHERLFEVDFTYMGLRQQIHVCAYTEREAEEAFFDFRMWEEPDYDC